MCAALLLGLLPATALADGEPFTADIRVDGRGMAVSVEGATKVESSNSEYMFDYGAKSVTVTITKGENYHGIRVRSFGEGADDSWSWLKLEDGVYTIDDLTKSYEIEVFDWQPPLYDNEFVVGYDPSDGFEVKLKGETVDAWGDVERFTEEDFPLTITTSETPYMVVVRPNDSNEIELQPGADNSYTYNPTTNVNAGFELIVYRTQAEYEFDTISYDWDTQFIAEYQVRFDRCEPDKDCTVTYDVTPEESAVYGERTRLVLANDTTQVKLTITAAEGYIYEVWADGKDVTESVVDDVYTWTFGENSDGWPEIVFRSEDDPGPEPDWHTVSWDGGNVTVENGTVLAERVHLGDKIFTVNAEESGASDSDNIYPIEDIIGKEGQEGLGVYGLGYGDTDLFIGNEVTEPVSIDFKFVPDYGYQLSDIRTNGPDSLLSGFTASASEISTFNFVVRPDGGNVHFNVEFTESEDIIQNSSSTVQSATIANGGNAIDSGNLKMTVADLDENAVSEDLKAQAGESALYLDMNLYQVVSKGGKNGNWENQLEDLTGTITVTLRVPAPTGGKSYYIVREHGDGVNKTYSRIAAGFVPDADNPAMGTVTFETDKFSNYALAQAADNVTTDKEVTTAKVTDAGIDTNYAWVDALPASAESATSVKLTVADSTANDTTKSALASKAGVDIDPDKSFYLDLTMTASDGSNTTPITELRQPVTVTLTVPELLASEKYTVVREHNGQYDVLNSTYDRTSNELTVQTDKFSTYAIFVIPAYAPTAISSVTVNVTAPTVDRTAADAAVTVDGAANYYVNAADTEWNKVTNKGSTASLEWLYDDDTFETDNWYWLSVTLYADFGYKFPDSITPTVSGAEQVSAESDGDTLEVYAWFKVGEAADTRTTISTVEVTNVATPVVGDSIWDTENSTYEHASTGTGYFIDGVDTYEWVEGDDDDDYSYWDWTYGNFAAGTAYGVELTLLADTGYAFSGTVTATINGKTAEVVSRTADELVLFLPFDDHVTITKVAVESATWPIDGNTIDKSPDNFSIDSYSFERLAYTLESAEFQILDGSTYRPLNPGETHFSSSNDYRVQAVLKAKDGATFASSVTGDFNGTSGTTCEVSADGKTCTVTRSCAVYYQIYTYTYSNYTHVNGINIHLPNPTAGQPYSLGSYGPTGNTGYLRGADASAAWY